MKHKRVWTEEQRMAAAERMRVMQAKRKETAASVALLSPEEAQTEINQAQSERVDEINAKIRAPEVQAVLDSMSPERRAKLQMIQAQTFARTLQHEQAAGQKATAEALARHEAGKQNMNPSAVIAAEQNILMTEEPVQILPPVQPMIIHAKHPFRFTSGQNGLMISELGPCLCGEPKLKWHGICLKATAHV